MNNKLLQIQQLDNKMSILIPLRKIVTPPTGWIRAIRTSLGISLLQLGKKLSITKQSVLEIEKREKDESITLKTLREAAKALDMQLVYGFIPIDNSLEDLINRKAKELAVKIVSRTSNTMKLEDQQNSNERISKAIQERTIEIKNEMPKSLWD